MPEPCTVGDVWNHDEVCCIHQSLAAMNSAHHIKDTAFSYYPHSWPAPQSHCEATVPGKGPLAVAEARMENEGESQRHGLLCFFLCLLRSYWDCLFTEVSRTSTWVLCRVRETTGKRVHVCLMSPLCSFSVQLLFSAVFTYSLDSCECKNI